MVSHSPTRKCVLLVFCQYPEGRKLKIWDVVTPRLLADPELYDREGQPCLIVRKDGTKTGLTFGRYADLAILLRQTRRRLHRIRYLQLGQEFGGVLRQRRFGAFVWDGLGCIAGQLHSRQSKGGSTSSHVTYATAGWWLLERIKAKFPHAIFYRTTWLE